MRKRTYQTIPYSNVTKSGFCSKSGSAIFHMQTTQLLHLSIDLVSRLQQKWNGGSIVVSLGISIGKDFMRQLKTHDTERTADKILSVSGSNGLQNNSNSKKKKKNINCCVDSTHHTVDYTETIWKNNHKRCNIIAKCKHAVTYIYIQTDRETERTPHPPPASLLPHHTHCTRGFIKIRINPDQTLFLKEQICWQNYFCINSIILVMYLSVALLFFFWLPANFTEILLAIYYVFNLDWG